MDVLGPMASYQGVEGVDPTNLYYVDLTDERLASDETVSSAYVTTEAAGITVSSVGPNTATFTKKDGTVVAIGKAVKWRVTATVAMKAAVVFYVTYVTSDNNADTIEATLNVVKTVK